ncbi:hypothetical protein C4B68_40810 (plasmid) [Streptomyces dengpaensis]|uniref:Uncharacterized protein n=1 Tax=Streptomyces dengpaensis TaxID=2049881 RepID=A0ABN5IF63_9ACTN|nr:hypothetical protein C4B68_40810 [Streptomyces dengpaensis]
MLKSRRPWCGRRVRGSAGGRDRNCPWLPPGGSERDCPTPRHRPTRPAVVRRSVRADQAVVRP